MARYPGTLESANTNEFGIVYADHIQGHRTVSNLESLYNISEAILSKSKTNSGNDAIGQEWFVVSENCYYRLDNWENRKQSSGWTKLQVVDTEFDSLENHGADKIKDFTTTSDSISLNYNTWKNSETSEDGSITIPAATGTNAGVLTADGKDQLDQLNKISEVSHFKDSEVFTTDTSKVTIHYTCVSTTSGSTSETVDKTADIPSATSSLAGVMTAADKVKLDTTLPNQISAETSRATTKEGQLESSINSNKGTIDNYTVNGIKISSNPVITGANALVTGYSKPSSTGAIAVSDSINGAIGKLEKKADDHIANKSNPHGVTKAQVGLGNCDNTSDANKPISTATQTALNGKVGSVTVTGAGNAITSASISGTVLTLTKGATYNNQTYTAGTNLSLSGNTFNLDDTISLTRVNASSGFFQTSDERLKSDIKSLEYTLDDICSIPTVSFIKGGNKEIGTLAQKLEDKFPEIVSEAEIKSADIPNPENFTRLESNGESYVLVKEVDYSKLSILALEGIKLLRKELEDLKNSLKKD